MLKIDLHIHTISTIKDSDFIFSLTKLKEYVDVRKLDVIAITNHNIFDIDNYKEIRSYLNIRVLPGIELDFCGGHLLIISDENNEESFYNDCQKVKETLLNHKFVNESDLKNIFHNIKDLLLIPHYNKKPKVPKDVINKLGELVYCGEVRNNNFFIRLLKSDEKISPVIFSDFRPTEESFIPLQCTYLDSNDNSFSSIKETLRDKKKVYFNSDKSNNLFPILEDGTLGSTGLNVIVGKRSSGKTYTMNRIYENFCNNFNSHQVKYIKQFELIEENPEKAENEFKENIKKQESTFASDYLYEFKKVVNTVSKMNLLDENTKLESYIQKLVEYALNEGDHDAFARVPVFVEQLYEKEDVTEIKNIIDAVIVLLNNVKYKDVINKNIPQSSLVKLLKELLIIYKKIELKNKIIEKTNNLIEELQQSLSIKSNQDKIPNFSFVQYAKELSYIERFNNLCKKMATKETIKLEESGKFKIEVTRNKIESARKLQNILGTKNAFSSVLAKYDNPYEYLSELLKLEYLNKDDIYKCFASIDYQVLNKNGYAVSGGERAEYNLERKLYDAENYDLLLIDEPESSFDNLFLMESINSRIKDLAEIMPVFISTHNSVIGASTKPNYILYTEMSIENKTPKFRVYSGEASSKELVCKDGKKISNYFIEMNCLEGGEISYSERKTTYENIKN